MEFLLLLTSFNRVSTPTPTRSHLAEPLYQYQPGLIRQSSTDANQALSGRAPQRCQPGLIRQSSTDANQALSGRAPHRCQPGLIRQSSASMPISRYQAELCANANQALSGRAPHRRQPGLIGQSFYTNANQASSGRAFTSTPTRPDRGELSTSMPTRPHWAKPSHQRQPGLIGQSFHINTNHSS